MKVATQPESRLWNRVSKTAGKRSIAVACAFLPIGVFFLAVSGVVFIPAEGMAIALLAVVPVVVFCYFLSGEGFLKLVAGGLLIGLGLVLLFLLICSLADELGLGR